MSDKQHPALFLERRSYRRRRLMDALRLLPILGVMLMMLPLFWPHSGGEGAVPMSTAITYVFATWFFLILCAIALWRGLWRGAADDDAPDKTPEDLS